MASKNSKNTQARKQASKWTPRRITLAGIAGAVTGIVGSLSAWTGTRLLLEARLAWYEAVPVPAVMDLMMVIAAFKLNTPGSNPTEKRVARHAMRFGLLLSLLTNVLSSFMHVTGGVGMAGWHGEMWQCIQVGFSWVPTAVLWLMVEMLTRQNAVAKAPGLVTRLVEAWIKKLTYRPRAAKPQVIRTEPATPAVKEAPAPAQVRRYSPLSGKLHIPTAAELDALLNA